MSLLKTKEYIDLVDLSNFLHAHYEWPALGTSGSFHSTFCDSIHEFSNGSMEYIEFDDSDSIEWYEENYSPSYAKVVEVFRKLMDDGHLPRRTEFEIYVWW